MLISLLVDEDRSFQSNIQGVKGQQTWFKLAPLFCCLPLEQRQRFLPSFQTSLSHRSTNPDLHTPPPATPPHPRSLPVKSHRP